MACRGRRCAHAHDLTEFLPHSLELGGISFTDGETEARMGEKTWPGPCGYLHMEDRSLNLA